MNFLEPFLLINRSFSRTVHFRDPFITTDRPILQTGHFLSMFTDCPFSRTVHLIKPFNLTDRPISLTVQFQWLYLCEPFITEYRPFLRTVLYQGPSIFIDRSFWQIVCFKRTSFALTVHFKTSNCPLSPDKNKPKELILISPYSDPFQYRIINNRCFQTDDLLRRGFTIVLWFIVYES